MFVEWRHDRCILCLEVFKAEGMQARSRAHVIPASVGGRLSVNCLCAKCNAHKGETFEKYLPLDPAIRLIIEQLAPELPLLARSRTKQGRRFIGRTEEGIVRVKAMPDGGYRLLPTKLEGGTRVQDTGDAEREMRGRLEKAQVPEEVIEAALTRFRAGVRVKIQDDLYVPRTGEIQVGLPLDEPDTPPEAFLGMAYLLLALEIRDAIYEAAYDRVRATLRADASGVRDPSWTVESGRVPDVDAEPAHMIGFDSLDPPVIRIQLFRTLLWLVHLPAASRRLDRRGLMWMPDEAAISGTARV